MQESVEVNEKPAMEAVPGEALPACGEVEAPSQKFSAARNITCQPPLLT